MGKLLATGVPGLDEILGGGLRQGTCTLLEGIPGAGKTTVGIQYIYSGALADEPGLIVTFEQFPEQIYEDALQFGWDLQALEQENRLRVVCTSPEVFLDQLSDVGGMVDTLIADIGARRLMVDSVAHLGNLADTVQEVRPLVYGMLNGIRRAGLTALVTKEVESASPETIPFEEYLVDTVIRLTYVMGDDFHRRRFAEVVKSRGQDHAHGRHSLLIGAEGVRIYPRYRPTGAAVQPVASCPVRLPTGVNGLDRMLGGGFPQGHTVLVAGSAGVGKTTLALEYIRTGVEAGEAGLFLSFEESPTKLQQLALGFGIDLGVMLKNNKLGLMHRSPLNLSPDQLIWEIKDEIKRLGAKRVVVDSLTDLTLTVRDPMQFRESVFLLAQALQDENVTTVFTTEVPELFGQTYVTSEHISIIVDGIILMKYLEMESEIQRAISVLKMRGCEHDTGIRRYTIDAHGLNIAHRFEGAAGVMAGNAQQTTIRLSVRSFSETDEALNEELMQRFSSVHPHVQPVSLSIPYNPDDARNTVRGALEAPGTTLSIAPLSLYWMDEFITSGRLSPLEDVIPPQELERHMDDFLRPGMYEGHVYAVPAMAVCGVLVYRRDLLEQYGFEHPPRTWEELIHQATTILEGENDPHLIGYQFPAYKYEGLTTSFLQNLWSNGGEVLQEGALALRSEPALNTLVYMHDLVHKLKLSPQNLATAAHGLEPQRDFLEGHTVFLTMLPNVVQAARRESSPLRDKVGLAPHPIGPLGSESITFLGGWHYAVPVGSKAPEAATQFIRFMTSHEIQKERSLRGGPLPTIGDLYFDPEVLAFNPDYPLLRRLLRTARKRNEIPHYMQVSGLIQAHLHPMIQGSTGPQETLDKLCEELDFIFRA